MGDRIPLRLLRSEYTPKARSYVTASHRRENWKQLSKTLKSFSNRFQYNSKL